MRHPPPLVRLATYAVAAAALVLGAALLTGNPLLAATPFSNSTKRLTVYEGVLQIHSENSSEIMELGYSAGANEQHIISSGKLFIRPGTGAGTGASAAGSYFSTLNNASSTQDFLLSGRIRVLGSGSMWPDVVGIYATQDLNSALYVEQSGAGYAGYFSGKLYAGGDLTVTGDIDQVGTGVVLDSCILAAGCNGRPRCDDATGQGTQGYPIMAGFDATGCPAGLFKAYCCKL